MLPVFHILTSINHYMWKMKACRLGLSAELVPGDMEWFLEDFNDEFFVLNKTKGCGETSDKAWSTEKGAGTIIARTS